MMTFLDNRYFLALALTTLMAPAGCDLPEDAAEEAFGAGDVSERCVGCGIKFNTFAFGKVEGGELDSRFNLHADAKLVSVELLCPRGEKEMWRYPKACWKDTKFVLEAQWGKAGELRGLRDGLEFAGDDFLGSIWTLDLYEGGNFVRTHVQTIEKHEYDELQKPHALHYYTFMFMGDGSNGGEKGVLTPACKEDLDPVDGTPVGTRVLVYDDITVDIDTGVIKERPDTLYFGCIAAAVGKAGNWGYPAWVMGAEKFTAAVRSVRADYCGDGDSWTVKGQALQVADDWGFSSFYDASTETEAIFTEYGAACLGTPRWGQVLASQVECNGAKLDPCKDAKLGDFPDGITWTKLP
jgi:hypothetical protein